MAVRFSTLDKQMNRDTEGLHDFLWHQKKEDVSAFVSRLLKDTRAADAFLRLGGRLYRNALPLAKGLNDPGKGESLFELLEHSWALGAATILAAKRDYRAAAGRAKNAAVSASIGVCANAGCFELVEEMEAGKTDFETYAGKLAPILSEKGVLDAGQFQRMLTAVHHFGTNWNAGAGTSEQALAARAAIEGAAWYLLTSVSIREMIGAPPKFSAHDFSEIVARIVGRV